MRHFDDPNRTTSTGITGFELAIKMRAQRELTLTKKAAKLCNLHTGPATRAKILVKKWKKHWFRPTYAPERGNRFIASTANVGYGASKEPYMDAKMVVAISKQDMMRKQNRFPTKEMHKLLCVANADLVLPGPQVTTEIVSVAGTRALGYAPLITPPGVIALECKYEMGEKADMAIELD